MNKISTLLLLFLMSIIGASAAPVTIKVADGTSTGANTYGTISGTTWTSNESAGMAGFVINWSGSNIDRGANIGGVRAFMPLTSAANGTYTLTMTAPEGYKIVSYQAAATCWQRTQTYTISTESGSTASVTDYRSATFSNAISDDNVNKPSATITVTATGTAATYIAVTRLLITIDVDNDSVVYADSIEATKKYALKNVRTMWSANATNLKTTADLSATENASQPINQFAFVKKDGNTYLYNIGQKKFARYDGTLVANESASPIYTWSDAGDAPYKFFFSFTSDKSNYNLNAGGQSQASIDKWNTYDDGNRNALIDKGDFDATEALEILSREDTVEVSAIQGYQTTGRGNEALLLAGQLRALYGQDARLTHIAVTLPDGTAQRVSDVKAYLTADNDNEFFAAPRKPFATATAADSVDLVSDTTLTAGSVYRLWITAMVKDDAPLGETVDAAINTLTYVKADSTVRVLDSLNIDPAGAAKIFKQQQFVFVPTTNNCRYYRIPAMIKAKDGSIVAVSDMRYNSEADLGNNHRIDLTVRRSTDNGVTWSDPVIFAEGNDSVDATIGYGDASLALAPSGKIICLMAAGGTNYFSGMKHMFMSTSDDNGITWTTPTDIAVQGVLTDEVSGTDGLGLFSAFATSGKGLTTKDGRVMYLLNGLASSGSNSLTYVLYTDDEGQHWTIGKSLVYGSSVASNEAKLVQRKDGSLLASIRQAGMRGFNIGNADGSEWLGESRATDLNGNDCNADIIVYNDSLMVHSLLTNTGTRANLHLFASTNQGKTWKDVYTIQEGLAAYSTMVVLDNGDLAVLYEDRSYDVNGYAINYVTLPKDTLQAWASAESTLTYKVVIADNTATLPTERGSFSAANADGWSNTWTSNDASGVAGLTVSADSAIFTSGTFWDSGFFRMRTPVANDEAEFYITAPEGYTITGYELGTHLFTVREYYALYDQDDKEYDITSSSRTNDTPTITATGLNTDELTLYIWGSGNQYGLMVPWFNVTVAKADQGYADYVASNLAPFFTRRVGNYFALSHEAYDRLLPLYEAYKDHCTLEQYFELRDSVMAGIRYPESGYYRIQSSGRRHGETYLAVGSNSAGRGTKAYGWGLKTVSAANAVSDASTIIKFTKVEGTTATYKLSTEGEGVVNPTSYNSPFELSADEDDGNSFIFTMLSRNPGYVTIQDSTITNGYGLLHEASGNVNQAYVCMWNSDGTVNPSTWRVVDVDDVALRLPLTSGTDAEGNAKYFSTLNLPYGATLTNAKAYKAVALGEQLVELKEVGTDIPANTPVVLISDADTADVTLNTTLTAEADTTNLLLGSNIVKTWDSSWYAIGLNGGKAGLFKSTDVNLAANHAYLATGDDATGYVFTLTDVTGIDGIHADTVIDANAPRYNVAGQRVDRNYKGVVIIGGKKVIVK